MILCGTFPGSGRPSEIARPLLEPHLSARITPLDWYAFDVACAARWHEMQQRDSGDAPAVNRAGATEIPSPRGPSAEARNGPVVGEGSSNFRIVGDEIPPWERR